MRLNGERIRAAGSSSVVRALVARIISNYYAEWFNCVKGNIKARPSPLIDPSERLSLSRNGSCCACMCVCFPSRTNSSRRCQISVKARRASRSLSLSLSPPQFQCYTTPIVMMFFVPPFVLSFTLGLEMLHSKPRRHRIGDVFKFNTLSGTFSSLSLWLCCSAT